MLILAYGSNMNCDQMRERCPSSRFMGIAVLRDQKLAFTRESRRRRCGVADAVAEVGRVWGVVYEIVDLDVVKLDASEGFRPGQDKNSSYCQRQCLVFLDGEDQRPLTVFTVQRKRFFYCLAALQSALLPLGLLKL